MTSIVSNFAVYSDQNTYGQEISVTYLGPNFMIFPICLGCDYRVVEQVCWISFCWKALTFLVWTCSLKAGWSLESLSSSCVSSLATGKGMLFPSFFLPFLSFLFSSCFALSLFLFVYKLGYTGTFSYKHLTYFEHICLYVI